MELNRLLLLPSLMLSILLLAYCPTNDAAATTNQVESGQKPPETGRSEATPLPVEGRLDVGAPPETAPEQAVSDADLIPDRSQLFEKDAIDEDALIQMDCHLRNMDYCYAGLLSTAARALPETDAEFEVRCDEMRATTSCLALFNKRCQSFKAFAALAPFGDYGRSLPADAPLPAQMENLLLGQNESSRSPVSSAGDEYTRKDSSNIKMGDLMALCEPRAKQAESNKALRRRLFQLAKCVNQRLPSIGPCIEDLKTALQLFYEPTRSLPMQPSCCAIGRFRQCATKALDDICGLSSLDQLEATFASGGAGPSVKTIERVCRQAARFDSPYCDEVLPPVGIKAPQMRGRKASKLAKALDLISFGP